MFSTPVSPSFILFAIVLAGYAWSRAWWTLAAVAVFFQCLPVAEALLYQECAAPCVLCWAHLWACCGSRHSIPWLSAGESLCQGQQPCNCWQIEFLWSSSESTALSLARNSRSGWVGVRLRVIFKSKSWGLCLSFCFPGWTSSLIQKIL